jgi:hypothetical protein
VFRVPYTDEILRALADPERLAIAGRLARGPSTADQLVEELDLRPDRVRKHLVRLAAVRVVSVDDDRRTHRLQPEVLREAAQDAGPPRDPGIALGAIDEDEESVLGQYFREGRLREIPAKHVKRLVVLHRIALEFEVGRRYSEREVNEIVIRFHDDYASLRRYLVDEELLSREHGEYWRTGGPVDV